MKRADVINSAADPRRTAVVRGRDHHDPTSFRVEQLSRALAVGICAGAPVMSRPDSDPNEDVGAVVRGPRANLLVVADGHFGQRASEVVVDHVLSALTDDPSPAISDDELVEVFFAAGIAVERETTRSGSSQPHSRATLALAIVTEDEVRWASMGDSCVVIATDGRGLRLDTPRRAYLGNRFTRGDVRSALGSGRSALGGAGYVVLATDGLVDGLAADGLDVVTCVSAAAALGDTAGAVAERLLMRALAHRARDAVTVAVALT
jgi:serine/threonine protein phosphatase PrpC